MNDSELCKMFGTTVEQVESDCEKYESGDFSGWEFGKPINGRPKARMNTTNDKTYTVSSREVIYKGAGNDVDLNPYRDAVLWYEGADIDEALRIARKYAADVRDTGKVEVCKNGVSRNVFEVCEVQLDEDGDIVDEDTIEIVDPLDRMPHLRELADKADRCRCQLPSCITGECKWIDDVEIDGKCYGLYRFELSAFGNFSAYTDNGGSVWLPAAFYDFDLKTAAQLKEVLEEVRGEWWQDWQSDDEFDQIIYKLFAAEC